LTSSGSIQKRPGDYASRLYLTGRIDKVWEYDTLPDSNGISYKYYIISVYNQGINKWTLYIYNQLFTTVSTPTLRDTNNSVRVHEIVIYKGKAYVKSFPSSSSSEKLGTIIIDGSGGTLTFRPWGILPPATPARITGKITKLNGNITDTAGTITVYDTTGFSASGRIQIGYELIDYTGKTATTFTGCTRGAAGTDKQPHDDLEMVLQRDWTASDHKVDVNDGWYYSYAYKSITGQVSSRAPISTNPDLLPSYTGPFFDLIPRVTLQGHADTTNIPKIVVYRTTDGGGTFLKLEEIDNPGAGPFTYYDDSLGSGALSTTYKDPLPDNVLDGEKREYGPSTTSNDPPPVVEPPLVTGTDTPSTLCYSMAVYAGRIWILLGKNLYYSSREELITGINEESFASGTKGNFIPLGELGVGLQATSRGLYVLTTDKLIKINGTTRDTFTDVQISALGGARPNHSKMGRNITATREGFAFIASDYNIVLVEEDQSNIISDPVVRVWRRSGRNINDIQYYRDYDYELLLCSYNNYIFGVSDPKTEWYFYDIKKSKTLKHDIWWPVWRMNSWTHLVTKTSSPTIYRVLYHEASDTSLLAEMYSFGLGQVSGTDTSAQYLQYFYNPSLQTYLTQNYGCAVYMQSLRPPTGNNLNLINRPQRNAELEGIYVHIHPGVSDPLYGVPNSDPVVTIRTDNTVTIDTLIAASPPRIQYHNDYSPEEKILYYPANRNCYRVELGLSDPVVGNRGLEIQRVSLWWDIAGGVE
jgi:hypothetical protein